MLPATMMGLRGLIGGAAPLIRNGAGAAQKMMAAHPNITSAALLGAPIAIDSAHTTQGEARQDQTLRLARQANNEEFAQQDPQAKKDAMGAHIFWQQIHNDVLASSPDYNSYLKTMERVKVGFADRFVNTNTSIMTPKEFRAVKNDGDWSLPFSGDN